MDRVGFEAEKRVFSRGVSSILKEVVSGFVCGMEWVVRSLESVHFCRIGLKIVR